MILRLVSAVLAIVACARNANAPLTGIALPSCPMLDVESKTRVDDSAALNRARKYPKFVSVIIDGKRAAWNYPISMMDEATSFGMKPGELKSMKLVEEKEGRQVYGSCPGVPLFLLETKSGKWHPPVSPTHD